MESETIVIDTILYKILFSFTPSSLSHLQLMGYVLENNRDPEQRYDFYFGKWNF